MDVEALSESVRRGEIHAAARACRIVDDELPQATELLSLLYPSSGKSFRIGVTGVPGAGKSTLTDALVERFRARGERVAVVAVDPTSPWSGGAVLGDRIRMQRHFEDAEVFIRSLATRGAMGGLSRTTLDVVRVLEAWGAGIVIVETVGVGQDELEVVGVADSVLVVVPPGLGDDVQATKAGILESADVFAVNKSDRPGAERTRLDLEAMLALGHEVGAASWGPGHGDAGVRGGPLAAKGKSDVERWQVPVLSCVATTGEGIDAVLTALEQHRAHLQSSGEGEQRLSRRIRRELLQRVCDGVFLRARARLERELDAVVARIQAGAGEPYQEAAALTRLLSAS